MKAEVASIVIVAVLAGCTFPGQPETIEVVPDIQSFAVSESRIDLGERVLLTIRAWNNGTMAIKARLTAANTTIADVEISPGAGKLIEKNVEWKPPSIGRHFVRATVGATERAIEVTVDGAVISGIHWTHGDSIWDGEPYLDVSFGNAGSKAPRSVNAQLILKNATGVVVVDRSISATAPTEYDRGFASFTDLSIKRGETHTGSITITPSPGVPASESIRSVRWQSYGP